MKPRRASIYPIRLLIPLIIILTNNPPHTVVLPATKSRKDFVFLYLSQGGFQLQSVNKDFINTVDEAVLKTRWDDSYTLVYQDGVMHAFERFLNGNKNGEYCNPGFLFSSIAGYEKMIIQEETAHRYIDQAYYEGYLNGLVLICGFENDNAIAKNFQLLNLPGKKTIPKSLKTYHKHLQELSSESNAYLEQAKKAIDRLLDQSKGDVKDVVIHHPPF